MDDQEYYYDGEYVTIYGEVKNEDDLVIVRNDHQDLMVTQRSNLVTKENSYVYRRAQERAAELRAITDEAEKNLDAIVDKVLNEAIARLATRIKMNVAFGEGGPESYAALTISKELEKMIKKEVPVIMRQKKF